jgi:hypothetical protein
VVLGIAFRHHAAAAGSRYRNAGARFFGSMFARGRINHKVFQKGIV